MAAVSKGSPCPWPRRIIELMGLGMTNFVAPDWSLPDDLDRTMSSCSTGEGGLEEAFLLL